MNYRKKQNTEAEINITPMLDVVFIMLIFFIVTTSFSKESGLSINRPIASTENPKKSVIAVVKIAENGEIQLNQQILSISALPAVMTKLRAENTELSALIVPQIGTRTGDLIAVMDKIKQVKVEKISIATAKKS